MTIDTSKWLSSNSGSSYPAVAFENVGDVVKGTIIEEPRVIDHKDIDGEDTQSLVVSLEVLEGTQIRHGKVDERVAASVGDKVTIWVKRGGMAGAIQKAIKAADATGLQEGGTLAVQYTGNGERKKAGWNPPKLYEAGYRAPVASVSVAGLV